MHTLWHQASPLTVPSHTETLALNFLHNVSTHNFNSQHQISWQEIQVTCNSYAKQPRVWRLRFSSCLPESYKFNWWNGFVSSHIVLWKQQLLFFFFDFFGQTEMHLNAAFDSSPITSQFLVSASWSSNGLKWAVTGGCLEGRKSILFWRTYAAFGSKIKCRQCVCCT